MDTSEVFISKQKAEPQPDYTAEELQRVTSFFDLLIRIDRRINDQKSNEKHNNGN